MKKKKIKQCFTFGEKEERTESFVREDNHHFSKNIRKALKNQEKKEGICRKLIQNFLFHESTDN